MMRALAVLLFLAAGASASVQWRCTEASNFIVGLQYSQRDLTDGCDANGEHCDENPIYNREQGPYYGKVCNKKALKWCKAQCEEQRISGEHAGNPCQGFFFQQHQNGHQICGFYHGGSAAMMHAQEAHWVHHNHKAGSICEVATEAPAQPVDELQMVQATVQLAAQLAHSEQAGDTFELAFRTVVAGSAGHVCGAADAVRGCSPTDVIITSLGGASIEFHLRVANGVLAAQAVSNIKGTWEDGTAFEAAVSAAGAADIAELKQLILGQVDVQPVQPAPAEEDAADDHDMSMQRMHRAFHVCPRKLMMGTLGLTGLVVVFMAFRRLLAPVPLQLAEEEAASASTSTPPKYEPVQDETSKEQV